MQLSTQLSNLSQNPNSYSVLKNILSEIKKEIKPQESLTINEVNQYRSNLSLIRNAVTQVNNTANTGCFLFPLSRRINTLYTTIQSLEVQVGEKSEAFPYLQKINIALQEHQKTTQVLNRTLLGNTPPLIFPDLQKDELSNALARFKFLITPCSSLGEGYLAVHCTPEKAMTILPHGSICPLEPIKQIISIVKDPGKVVFMSDDGKKPISEPIDIQNFIRILKSEGHDRLRKERDKVSQTIE